MNQFNLERFLAGEPAETTTGTKVAWYAYDKEARNGSRLIVRMEGSGVGLHYWDDGKYYENVNSPSDLVMSQQKKKYWVRELAYFSLVICVLHNQFFHHQQILLLLPNRLLAWIYHRSCNNRSGS